MEASLPLSVNAVIFKPVNFHKFIITNSKPVKYPLLSCCLRKKNGNSTPSNNSFKSPPKLEVGNQNNVEMSQQNDIWKLFKEAQQNILYLNKQRVLAVEELNKANREKELLLDKIEQLEAELQAAAVRKDKQSMCCELLLRIDSMVLTGMITTLEASNLRKAVMDYKFSIADMLLDNEDKSDAELLAELRHFAYGSKTSGLHIIHICTEMAPVAEVGSLASYVTGLSHALQKKGHLVEVILPKYSSLNLNEIHRLREIQAESYSYFNGQLHGNKIWTGVVNGIGVTFIEPVYYSSFFNREKIYGYADDFERFSYFSRASLDFLAKSGKQPDVLHIHNWETAIVGPLFWDIFVHQGLERTRILLTCHSFDSQCLEKPDKLALCGLDPGSLHRPDRFQDDAKTQFVNILKGGVVYSNKVVIVSSIHSKGRFIQNFSHGFGPTLSIHQDKVLVTPCGFDKSTWDPSRDRFLPVNYSEDDLTGKAVCKVELQQSMGLSNTTSTVLVGCIVSELSDFDLRNLKEVVWSATMNDAQFVFFGSMPSANRALEELKGENVRFITKYDEALLHLIFAGSDVIVCQSFHDALLQVPLKALKYGAAPISLTSIENRFRNRDFVDADTDAPKFSKFIGSTFGNMSLKKAIDEIKNNPTKWKQKIVDAMAMDFSWEAECYDIHISSYMALKNL